MPRETVRKRLLFGLALCLSLTLASGCSAQRLETQSWEEWNAAASPTFPGERWMMYATPEEAGWSSQKLAAVERDSKAAGSTAVMVIFDGTIVAAWGDVGRRFKCHSMRKSLLSALYGIAVSQGTMDINATIGSIGIDDDRPLTETEKSAKVSDLLKARSGIYLPAAYETPSMRRNRPTRGSHAPGTHWYYNNWDFNVLATVYNKETGGDLFEAFQREIALPLQMQDFALRHTYYHLEPQHSRHAAYPFRMSARDLARVGLLFLNDGRWQGEEIVAPAWVRESTTAFSRNNYGGYGYMWWTFAGELAALGAYAALGYGGHAIYVVPGARLVFVHRADTYNNRKINHRQVRALLQQILAARIGPPRADPQRLAATAPKPSETQIALTPDVVARVTGKLPRREALGDGAASRRPPRNRESPLGAFLSAAPIHDAVSDRGCGMAGRLRPGRREQSVGPQHPVRHRRRNPNVPRAMRIPVAGDFCAAGQVYCGSRAKKTRIFRQIRARHRFGDA